MGYGSYRNHRGRECGYLVEATCDHPGCVAEIDRGYDYLCGSRETIHGAGVGCGGYFCGSHRGCVVELKTGDCVHLCDKCAGDPCNESFIAHDPDPIES